MDQGSSSKLHLETVAIRAGRPTGETSLAPVVYPTTTHVLPSVAAGRAASQSTTETRLYSRHGNPTVRAFEDAIASLEGAEAARAFASGMGALSAVVLGLCSQGDHVVAQRQLYGGTLQLLLGPCARFGIDVTLVDATAPGAFAKAVRPGKTMLVLAETPANPQLDLVDLDELCALRGPPVVVDSTFATPLGQSPLRHGAALVVHSATKAIGGHNDASVGVVAGRRDLVDWLWGFAVLQGANASPHDCAAALRGLRTLPVRLARQSATAQRLAEALEASPAVARVRYPGLASHPQHALARRQLRHMGGMVTFDLAGGLAAGRAFVEALTIAQLATSLGGPETLATHPASTTHAALSPEELADAGIGPGTVRLSVGLEHEDDLLADVAQALSAAVAASA